MYTVRSNYPEQIEYNLINQVIPVSRGSTKDNKRATELQRYIHLHSIHLLDLKQDYVLQIDNLCFLYRFD